MGAVLLASKGLLLMMMKAGEGNSAALQNMHKQVTLKLRNTVLTELFQFSLLSMLPCPIICTKVISKIFKTGRRIFYRNVLNGI